MTASSRSKIDGVEVEAVVEGIVPYVKNKRFLVSSVQHTMLRLLYQLESRGGFSMYYTISVSVDASCVPDGTSVVEVSFVGLMLAGEKDISSSDCCGFCMGGGCSDSVGSLAMRGSVSSVTRASLSLPPI